MQNSFKRISLFMLLCITLLSCSSDVLEPIEANEAVQLQFPTYFPEQTYNEQDNPLTKNGVSLGRKLFYEGRLSRNNTISCGFCHIQENAFTHHGHNISHGIDDRLGIRNTPAIQNMAFLKNMMWDGVIHNLNEQPLIPITDSNEMDSSIKEIITKLSADSKYRSLFKSAFGTDEITGDRILKALSQFMATMISSNSRYDLYLQGKGSLSTEEMEGLKVFTNKCASCHSGSLFTDQSYRNTGMYYNKQIEDAGRYRVTLDEKDWMKFRVPSLRNVALTAPYMHDGRFYSLEAVLNFYSDSVEDSPNLDPLLRENGKRGISMTSVEKKYIIAFLNTLTDTSFISNPKFSEQ